MMTRRWTDSDVGLLGEQYATKGGPACAIRLGRTLGAIHAKAQHLNLRGSFLGGPRAYSVNEAFFDLPLTEPAGFVGGFWLADGSASSHTVRFYQSSPAILEYIRALMVSKHLIYHNARADRYTLCIGSKRMAAALARLFPFPLNRKSWEAEYPHIPPELDGLFIRGIFEGDGCITVDSRRDRAQLNFSLAGTHALLAGVQQRLMEHCNLGKTKLCQDRRSPTTYRLQYVGNLQVPRIMSWLYPPEQVANKAVFLEGKYAKYLQPCCQLALQEH